MSLRRVPIVTLGLALLCFAFFVGTLPAQHELDQADQLEKPLRELFSYWATHPYLELSPELLERMPGLENALEEHRRRAAELGVEEPTPGILKLEKESIEEYEQPVLEQLRAFDEHNAIRKWGLIPARGLRQAGWLTHAFLHLGWLHLLGNLFYLLLLGAPLLEDAWGRTIFATFYLLAAVAAAALYALLTPGSQIVLVGASGAIAACVGAAVYRFANRKVRIAFLLNAWRGFSRPGSTFTVRAWLWGLVWFATELYNLLRYHSSAGVAFAAHVGGFGFGVLFAIAMRASGMERLVDAPVEQTTADEALTDSLRLARVKLALGQAIDAQQVMAKALTLILARPGAPQLEGRWSELVTLHGEGGIGHGLAVRLAEELENSDDDRWRFALSLYRAAGAAPGTLGQKASLRSVTLRLERHDSLKAAADDLERLLADSTLPDLLRTKALAADQKLRAAQGQSLQ